MSNTVTNVLNSLNVNDSIRFILPMLGNNERKDSFFVTPEFAGCFIGDYYKTSKEYQDKIFLVYNYKLTSKFVRFERSLELLPHYITDYDYPEERTVVYVFDVPEEFKEDFNKFKEGLFTEFSEDLKQRILNFWGINKEDSLIYGALYGGEFIEEYWKESRENFDFESNQFWPRPAMSVEIYMKQ